VNTDEIYARAARVYRILSDRLADSLYFFNDQYRFSSVWYVCACAHQLCACACRYRAVRHAFLANGHLLDRRHWTPSYSAIWPFNTMPPFPILAWPVKFTFVLSLPLSHSHILSFFLSVSLSLSLSLTQ
jgi:hypothetical protein